MATVQLTPTEHFTVSEGAPHFELTFAGLTRLNAAVMNGDTVEAVANGMVVFRVTPPPHVRGFQTQVTSEPRRR